ncbi:MFS transporter [Enterococcus alishanensis]|uniref:MFS transporter n=1 Tax=Enterococcus alishanensis TaxID=1303817 RepID=A0ABS6T7M6_9ENTE|nr:MFS transporter [Enterococcus alishanensis]MBV7389148.1 MFS transporter [Enterococcus alishanensis]
MKKSIYHGWFIVLTCMVIMAFVFAPRINLVGVFVQPLSESFGVSRTAVTLMMTIGTIVTMLGALFVAGKLFQKVKIKKVMTVAIVLEIIAFIGYALAPNIYVIYFFAVIGGFNGVCLTSIPISILINSWFGPKLRGRAMGIAMLGSGLGSMILNPVMGFIIQEFSWRWGYALIAVLNLIVTLPLILFTIANSPAEKNLEQIGQVENTGTSAVNGLSFKQARHTSIFWIMAFAFILYSAVSTIFNANGAAYYTDIGFTPIFAASLISFSSAALLVGKLILGEICDRTNAFTGAAIASMVMFFGVVLILVTSNIPSMGIPSAIVFGLGNALPTVTIPLLTAEMFGNLDYGQIVSKLNVASSFGAALGPILGSSFYDMTGSYSSAWYIVLFLMAGMTIITLIGKTMTKQLHNKMEGVERIE